MKIGLINKYHYYNPVPKSIPIKSLEKWYNLLLTKKLLLQQSALHLAKKLGSYTNIRSQMFLSYFLN